MLPIALRNLIQFGLSPLNLKIQNASSTTLGGPRGEPYPLCRAFLHNPTHPITDLQNEFHLPVGGSASRTCSEWLSTASSFYNSKYYEIEVSSLGWHDSTPTPTEEKIIPVTHPPYELTAGTVVPPRRASSSPSSRYAAAPCGWRWEITHVVMDKASCFFVVV